MFLVDDNETQIRQRRKNGGTSTHDDVYVAVNDTPPLYPTILSR
jgi:hypothetical protein